jgi:hypothetical protein
MADNVKVMVRIRPPNPKELSEGGRTCVTVNDADTQSVVLEGSPKPRQFAYDWAGGPNTSQQEIFNFVGHQMVETCLAGRGETE